MNFLAPFKHEVPNFLWLSKSAYASFFRWMLTLIVSIICWVSLIAFTTAVTSVLFPEFYKTLTSNTTADGRTYQILFSLLILALYIPTLGFSMWIVKLPLRRLINPRGHISYARIFLAAIITLIVLLASLGIDYTAGEPIRFQFWSSDKFVIVGLSFFAILFQATAEELFFRGMIIQILGKLTRSFWILLLIPSLMFWLMHFGNPEMAEMGNLVHGFYISLGLVLTALTLLTGRLEYSIGLHIANNLFVFLVINNTAYPSLTNNIGLFSIFQPIDPYTMSASILAYLLIAVLILYVAKWKTIVGQSPNHA